MAVKYTSQYQCHCLCQCLLTSVCTMLITCRGCGSTRSPVQPWLSSKWRLVESDSPLNAPGLIIIFCIGKSTIYYLTKPMQDFFFLFVFTWVHWLHLPQWRSHPSVSHGSKSWKKIIKKNCVKKYWNISCSKYSLKPDQEKVVGRLPLCVVGGQ